MKKINLIGLMLGLFLVFGATAQAELNYSSDCVAYKNESIKCGVDGKSLIGRFNLLDNLPFGYYDFWTDIQWSFEKPSGWSEVYVRIVSKYSNLKSNALLKDNYLRLIDYIRINHLEMNPVNNILFKASEKQKCAASVYVRNMKGLAWEDENQLLNLAKVQNPLDAMKLCNETDSKLLNCGLNYLKEETYPNKSFKWLLGVCTEKHKFRGSIDEIYGNTVIAKPVAQSEVGIPQSFLEAWKMVGSNPIDSLTQVQSTKVVFSQLNTEWLGLVLSDEYESGVYSNRNRVLAPLFFYVLNNAQNLELSHRTRFKIDLINNIDLVFSVGPSALKNKGLLEKITTEKKEILRLIEAI